MTDAAALPVMSRDIQQKLAGALASTEAPADRSHRETGFPDAEMPASFRGLTPFWLFCRPFEEMLGDEPLPPNATRITRAAAAVCWQAIEDRVAPLLYDAVENELAALAAQAPLDQDALDNLGRPWWLACCQSLSAAIADTRAGRSRLLAERTPKNLFEQAQTIAAALAVAAPIQRVKRLLGPPPASLAAASLRSVRATLDEITHKYDVRVVAHVVAHGLADPAAFLVAIATIDHGRTSPEGVRLGATRDALVLAHAAEQLAALDQPIVGPAALAAAVDRVGIAAATLASAGELVHHGASSGFLRDAERLQQALAGRLEAALLPALRADIVAARRTPETPPTPVGLMQAEATARLLARLLRSAALIGAESAVRKVLSEMLGGIETALASFASDVPLWERPPEQTRTVAGLVRIAEILAGSDHACELLTAHAPLFPDDGDSVARGARVK